jgi:hypothetical protein
MQTNTTFTLRDEAQNSTQLDAFKIAFGKDGKVLQKLSELGLKWSTGLPCDAVKANHSYLIIEHGMVSFYPDHEWRAYQADSAKELTEAEFMSLSF